MRKLIVTALLMAVSCLALAEESSGARDVVAKLDTALIGVMKKADSLGYTGRYKELEPIVRDTHDFESISKLAVGPAHWKALSEAQRADLINKLAEYSVATYAAQFDGYSGEEFKYESEEAKGKRVTVRYVLSAPGEQDRKFDYVLGQVGDKWLIINIVVDGVSDLALKRAQFEHVIETGGFNKLLDKLSEIIAGYAKSRASAS